MTLPEAQRVESRMKAEGLHWLTNVENICGANFLPDSEEHLEWCLPIDWRSNLYYLRQHITKKKVVFGLPFLIKRMRVVVKRGWRVKVSYAFDREGNIPPYMLAIYSNYTPEEGLKKRG